MYLEAGQGPGPGTTVLGEYTAVAVPIVARASSPRYAEYARQSNIFFLYKEQLL
jgi:hypothetical protein